MTDIVRWLALSTDKTLTAAGRAMFAGMAKPELEKRAPLPQPGQPGAGIRLMSSASKGKIT